MGANCGACADNTTVEDIVIVAQPVFSQTGEDEVEECNTEFDGECLAKEHKGCPSRTASGVSSNASTVLPPQRATSDVFSIVSTADLCTAGLSTAGDSNEAPAYDFVVTVTKNPGDGFAVKDDALGAQLGNTDKGAAIFNIHQGGLLDSWNQAAHPDELLHPGFVITQVNGRTGYWKIVEELRKPGVLNIKVSTTPPESAGPRWFEEIAEKGRRLESAGGKNSYMLRLPCFLFEFCVFA